MDKHFVDAEDLILDSYRLGAQIFKSGFRPDFIIGLWRGGSAVGIAVQECLQHLGVETDHIAARTSYTGMASYRSMIRNASEIRVHGLQYPVDCLSADKKLLIVDDVYSTGLNVKAVIDELARKTRLNMPKDIRVAATWCKPNSLKTGRPIDFCIHETNQWLVLPYELSGLTQQEIRTHRPEIAPIIEATQDIHSQSS
ncbi:MAG: hypothetical protein KUG75_15455 [Pseudomonadales bacterium]|nr:hypothetical protein [Pseudomonadales bacterium]